MTESYISENSDTTQSNESQDVEGAISDPTIILKTTLVVLTMVGGAILALCINVFYWEPAVYGIPPEVCMTDKEGRKLIGHFKNKASDQCLISLGNTATHQCANIPLGLCKCDKANSGPEIFVFSKSGQIRQNKFCVVGEKKDAETLAELAICDPHHREQHWTYVDYRMFRFHDMKSCLSSTKVNKTYLVKIETCDANNQSQIWELFKE